MLTLGLLTSSPHVAAELKGLTSDSTLFKLVFTLLPFPSIPESMRALRTYQPEVILIDLSDWDAVASLVSQVKAANLHGVILGIRQNWNRLEQLTFEEAGIKDLLREPLTHADLEAKAYEVLHRDRPIGNQNLVAFFPAKAGGGCSTVALHTASALAAELDKKVLVIESDRRSGVISIMLNQNNRTGLSDALQSAGTLTPGDWIQHCVDLSGMDLLLANPARPGPLPTWADYYQLLRFIQARYGFVAADMPELVNVATAELVKAARSVCIVCTPEIPSLMLATQRRAEIAACGIPKENLHIVLNWWERGDLPMPDVEKILGQPVFAVLPNDYKQVKRALVESRLISSDSAFVKACAKLGRKLNGLPVSESWPFKVSFLKNLGKMSE
jgi:Mrp family chromosome partitioning ATPase